MAGSRAEGTLPLDPRSGANRGGFIDLDIMSSLAVDVADLADREILQTGADLHLGEESSAAADGCVVS